MVKRKQEPVASSVPTDLKVTFHGINTEDLASVLEICGETVTPESISNLEQHIKTMALRAGHQAYATWKEEHLFYQDYLSSHDDEDTLPPMDFEHWVESYRERKGK